MGNLSGLVRLLPIGIGFVIIAVMAARGCTTGPFGRSQVVNISPEQELQLGQQAYQQILSKERGHVMPPSDPRVEAVRAVGNRLRIAAEDPAVREKLSVAKNLKLEWEFNLIDSPQVNAFCLPGGKVAVYTGILPVCETDAGLAVVMGHEIGHALARHGAERMTQEQMVNVAQIAVASSLGSMDPQKQRMVIGLLGAGAQVGVLLPFSRSHESEADHIGVVLMAAAGYDPREASRFWMRMTERTKGGSGSSFLSTHPSHETRINDLQKWATTEALAIYNAHPHAPDGNRSLLDRSRAGTPVTPPKSQLKGKDYEFK